MERNLCMSNHMSRRTIRVICFQLRGLWCALALVAGMGLSLASEQFAPGGSQMKILPQHIRQQVPDDLAATAWPVGIIDADRTHYLNQDSLTPLMLAIANPRKIKPTSVTVVCELPASVKLRTTNAHLVFPERIAKNIERDGTAYVQYSIPVSPGQYTFGDGKYGGFVAYQPPVLWLTTAQSIDTKLGKAYFRLQYSEPGEKARKTGPEMWVHLGVLPKLQADTPKLARTGLMGRASISVDPTDKVARELLPGYIGQMGCNYYYDGPFPLDKAKGSKRWTEGRNNWQIGGSGFRHNLSNSVGVGNGFHLHLKGEVYRTIPSEIAYIEREMSKRANTVSPWALYRKHPWVVKNVLEPIRQAILRGDYEGVWANWEPFMFMENGDYSEGSKKEFIRWSKLPADEVNKLWPHKLVKRYPKKWKAFRNWELAQWTKIVAETIRDASKEAGGDGYLIISTVNDYMWDGGNIVDYRTWPDFEYVWQTWNYYFVPVVTGEYPVSDRSCAPQLIRSGSLARHIDKVFGTNRKLKTSCVYGWDQGSSSLEGRCGFFLPEQVGFLQLSTILAGMDIVSNYGEWPIFDGRYSAALARANTRIARWEDSVLKGRKERKHVTVPISPYPQTVSLLARPEDQKVGPWAHPGYLFSYEYALHGKRIIAVANTWDNGECFFKLKVLGRDPKKTYSLTEPEEKRIFADAAGNVALSAKDLANGVVLHVGAMRWGVFQIEPSDKTPESSFSVITPAEMDRAIEQRRDILLKAALHSKNTWLSARKRAETKQRLARFAEDIVDRFASVKQVPQVPLIDGKLDDPCWKSATMNGSFRTAEGWKNARYATVWQAVRKDDVLYYGIRCAQDMTSPVVQANERDAKVWLDDSIEVFINQPNQMAQREFFQVIVNPAGILFDQYKGNPAWNGIVDVATQTSKDGWAVEMAVPLKEIGFDSTRQRILRVNIVRNVEPTAHNQAETSSWFPIWGPHSNAKARGILVLE